VLALIVYNGELIAGGTFPSAGGVNVNYIARWNGSAWQACGSGMDTYVYALTTYRGDLIAGGRFHAAGGLSANHVCSLGRLRMGSVGRWGD